jgi:hypothetical protein
MQMSHKSITTDTLLGTQADSFSAAVRELVEQARRGQEARGSLTQKSTNSYIGFLDSLFLYYRESVRAAEEKGTKVSTNGKGWHRTNQHTIWANVPATQRYLDRHRPEGKRRLQGLEAALERTEAKEEMRKEYYAWL